MIHIVFQETDINILAKSFDLDETLRGDIIQVRMTMQSALCKTSIRKKV
jgi:hypothetical protein